jgi:hypothetical protein
VYNLRSIFIESEPFRIFSIIVVANIELANGAGLTSGKQPLVDAGRVEVMEAGHGPYLFSGKIVFNANHAFVLITLPVD